MKWLNVSLSSILAAALGMWLAAAGAASAPPPPRRYPWLLA